MRSSLIITLFGRCIYPATGPRSLVAAKRIGFGINLLTGAFLLSSSYYMLNKL